MANEKKQDALYSKDIFDKEMQMIDDELADLDSLYTELKGHFDKVKNSQTKGSLTFVKDQTSNLISIKTAKLSYIKQKADMKKNITDFAFKDKQISKEGEGIDTFTNELYKKIANEIKYIPDKVHDNVVNTLDDNDVEQMLDEELDTLDIGSIVESTTSVEEVVVDYSNETEEEITDVEEENILNNLEEELEETDNTIDAVDLDTLTFYKVDKDTFEVVDELGYIEEIVDNTEIDGETYAIGESGTVYLTIIFDDEDDE